MKGGTRDKVGLEGKSNSQITDAIASMGRILRLNSDDVITERDFGNVANWINDKPQSTVISKLLTQLMGGSFKDPSKKEGLEHIQSKLRQYNRGFWVSLSIALTLGIGAAIILPMLTSQLFVSGAILFGVSGVIALLVSGFCRYQHQNQVKSLNGHMLYKETVRGNLEFVLKLALPLTLANCVSNVLGYDLSVGNIKDILSLKPGFSILQQKVMLITLISITLTVWLLMTYKLVSQYGDEMNWQESNIQTILNRVSSPKLFRLLVVTAQSDNTTNTEYNNDHKKQIARVISTIPAVVQVFCSAKSLESSEKLQDKLDEVYFRSLDSDTRKIRGNEPRFSKFSYLNHRFVLFMTDSGKFLGEFNGYCANSLITAGFVYMSVTGFAALFNFTFLPTSLLILTGVLGLSGGIYSSQFTGKSIAKCFGAFGEICVRLKEPEFPYKTPQVIAFMATLLTAVPLSVGLAIISSNAVLGLLVTQKLVLAGSVLATSISIFIMAFTVLAAGMLFSDFFNTLLNEKIVPAIKEHLNENKRQSGVFSLLGNGLHGILSLGVGVGVGVGLTALNLLPLGVAIGVGAIVSVISAVLVSLLRWEKTRPHAIAVLGSVILGMAAMTMLNLSVAYSVIFSSIIALSGLFVIALTQMMKGDGVMKPLYTNFVLGASIVAASVFGLGIALGVNQLMGIVPAITFGFAAFVVVGAMFYDCILKSDENQAVKMPEWITAPSQPSERGSADAAVKSIKSNDQIRVVPAASLTTGGGGSDDTPESTPAP